MRRCLVWMWQVALIVMDTKKRMDKNDNEVWENLLCFFHSSNFLVQLCWRVTADILDWCVNNDFLHDEVQYSTDK